MQPDATIVQLARRPKSIRKALEERFQVREKTAACDSKIEDFFFDTFYWPEDMPPLPRSILALPFYRKYFGNLGGVDSDVCFEAYDHLTNEIVGVVWTRIINDGQRAEHCTPILFISVAPSYRDRGIGTALLLRILSELRLRGYTKVELSVHRANRAVALYKSCGFSIDSADAESYHMINIL